MSLPDTSKLCIHTITTKPWPIEEAIAQYSRAGVKGITVWRQALEGRSPATTARRIHEAGLTVCTRTTARPSTA